MNTPQQQTQVVDCPQVRRLCKSRGRRPRLIRVHRRDREVQQSKTTRQNFEIRSWSATVATASAGGSREATAAIVKKSAQTRQGRRSVRGGRVIGVARVVTLTRTAA